VGKHLVQPHRTLRQQSLPLRSSFQAPLSPKILPRKCRSSYAIPPTHSSQHEPHALLPKEQRTPCARTRSGGIFECSIVFWSTRFGVCYLIRVFQFSKAVLWQMFKKY
jgi:hypothetical protein